MSPRGEIAVPVAAINSAAAALSTASFGRVLGPDDHEVLDVNQLIEDRYGHE
jgi:hypothetical protein